MHQNMYTRPVNSSNYEINGRLAPNGDSGFLFPPPSDQTVNLNLLVPASSTYRTPVQTLNMSNHPELSHSNTGSASRTAVTNHSASSTADAKTKESKESEERRAKEKRDKERRDRDRSSSNHRSSSSQKLKSSMSGTKKLMLSILLAIFAMLTFSSMAYSFSDSLASKWKIDLFNTDGEPKISAICIHTMAYMFIVFILVSLFGM